MGQEQDFQYVLQDFSNVYMGARLTFLQLTQKEDTPQRLSSAIYRYVFPEHLQDVRICDHLLTVREGTMPYMIYEQIKAQVKVVYKVEQTDKKGKIHTEYKTETYPVTEFIKNDALRSRTTAEQIMEITCKKLNLYALHV